MTCLLVPLALPGDRDALADFLAGNTFRFHAGGTPAREQALARIDGGAWDGDDRRTWWLAEDGRRVGLVRADDLHDDTVMLDVRVADADRGRGLGVTALRLVAGEVFRTTQASRLEGITRVDNLAMRRAFERAGWVQESHHRRAWPVDGGEPHAGGPQQVALYLADAQGFEVELVVRD